MKINLLDAAVYNKIAAGEVVENPASVVKELAENSLDAGADLISIYIEDGGIKYIEVVDNGSGIPKEELYKTVLPHATSKIDNADELFSVSTLGFRGEALASISAVSDVEIISKFYASDVASKLICKAGETALADAAYSEGTAVRVRNLFYNTPARFKFLKSKKSEESAVTQVVQKLILTNPYTAFAYYVDKKQIYLSEGGGLKSAIRAIYPNELCDNLIYFDNSDLEKNYIISGYISNSGYVKNSRSFQTFTVNGRPISEPTVSMTVQNAYGDRLMRRSFPVYVINLVIPFDEVDVNVHPSKKEVRFESPRNVYGAIYRTVKAALEDYEYKENAKLFSVNKSSESNASKLTLEYNSPVSEKAYTKTESNVYKNPYADNSLFDYTSNIFANRKINVLTESVNDYSEKSNQPIVDIAAQNSENVLKTDFFDTIKDIELNKSEEITSNNEIGIENTNDYRVVGQIFNTYIIVESGDNAIIIDQHAVHERLIYDDFCESIKKADVVSQPLIAPYIFNGTTDEINSLLSINEELTEMGFDIIEFGHNTVKISAVPHLLAGISVKDFISDIFKFSVGKITIGALIKDELAKAACKSAIKGGDSLSLDQIKYILNNFFKKGIPLKCPHGRPAFAVYKKAEFEKAFRRKL